MSADVDANDALQSALRILQATADLVALISGDRPRRVREELLPHIQANLDHIAKWAKQ